MTMKNMFNHSPQATKVRIELLMELQKRETFLGPKKTGTASVKQPEIRYGKLWEFIRDLLKNEKYNPKIIT